MAVLFRVCFSGLKVLLQGNFSLINSLIKRKGRYFKIVKSAVNWLPRKDPDSLTSYCYVYLSGVWSIIAFSGHNIFVPSDH